MPDQIASITYVHRVRQLIKGLERITDILGKGISWLTILMVLATCVVVILRRGLDVGSIALQESVTYMHAAVFLLGAAYALKQGAQVRVDIFYRQFSQRSKAWVDSLGALTLLLPVSIFIGVISWDFVMNSWLIREQSTDSGGVGMVYILKALIPLAAASLCIQAIAELLRNLLVLMGLGSDEDAAP